MLNQVRLLKPRVQTAAKILQFPWDDPLHLLRCFYNVAVNNTINKILVQQLSY